jgi:hypothetical protein
VCEAKNFAEKRPFGQISKEKSDFTQAFDAKVLLHIFSVRFERAFSQASILNIPNN